MALGAVVRRSAPAFGAVVPPRPDRWHRAPTPTMGGIAIAVATAAGFGITVSYASLAGSAAWIAVLLAAAARAVLGDERVDGRLGVEAAWVDVDAERANLVEVGPPLADLIGFLFHAHSRPRVLRTPSRMPLMNRTDSSPLKVRASSRASLMITLPGVSGWWRNS